MSNFEFPTHDDISNHFLMCLLITVFVLIVSLASTFTALTYTNYRLNSLERQIDRMVNGAHLLKIKDFNTKKETNYINIGMVEYTDNSEHTMFFPAYMDEATYSPYIQSIGSKVMNRIQAAKAQRKSHAKTNM